MPVEGGKEEWPGVGEPHTPSPASPHTPFSHFCGDFHLSLLPFLFFDSKNTEMSSILLIDF